MVACGVILYIMHVPPPRLRPRGLALPCPDALAGRLVRFFGLCQCQPRFGCKQGQLFPRKLLAFAPTLAFSYCQQALGLTPRSLAR